MTATKEPSAFSPDITSEPIARRQKRSTFPVIDLYRSAVGKKWVMAVTGILLMGFVFAHMVGNTKMYFGAEDFDSYAEFLRRIAYPLVPETGFLWIMRVGLIAAFAFHMHAAYSLTVLNRKARPVGYQSRRDYIAVNWANRSMRWTGVIILLFVIFHLMDLTWGRAPVATSEYAYGAAYANVAFSLERWPVAVIYILCNVALGDPPVPRVLEHLPDPRHDELEVQPPSQSAAPRLRTGLRGHRRRRQHLVPDRRSHRRRRVREAT